MSDLTVGKIQIGTSPVAANNYILQIPNIPDGSLEIRKGTLSAPGVVVGKFDPNGLFIPNNRPTLSAVQSTTSGTFKDFDIPSWVKEFTVTFQGLRNTGGSVNILQIGTSNSFETSGYQGSTGLTTSAVVAALWSTGVLFRGNSPDSSANIWNGSITFTLHDPALNIWCISGASSLVDLAAANIIGGSKTLTAPLTRVRLTTVAGNLAYTAGSINVLYKG